MSESKFKMKTRIITYCLSVLVITAIGFQFEANSQHNLSLKDDLSITSVLVISSSNLEVEDSLSGTNLVLFTNHKPRTINNLYSSQNNISAVDPKPDKFSSWVIQRLQV